MCVSANLQIYTQAPVCFSFCMIVGALRIDLSLDQAGTLGKKAAKDKKATTGAGKDDSDQNED